MLVQTLIASIVLTGITSNALANDQREAIDPAGNAPGSSAAVDDTSASERSRVRYHVGAEFYLGGNLSAGYQFDKDTAFEVFAETGQLFVFTSCGPGTIDKNYIYGANIRRYFGNSANFTVSPYYRTVKSQCLWTGDDYIQDADGEDPELGSMRPVERQDSRL